MKTQILFIILVFATNLMVAQNRTSYHPLGENCNARVTSSFGYRNSTHSFHSGIDLDGQIGDNIYAWRKGKIITTGYSKTMGYYIKIAHSNGFATYYLHLSKIFVQPNQRVNSGEIIAEMGNSGRVYSSGGDGSHLHFEIIHNGKKVDPAPYLKQNRTIYYASNTKIKNAITINSYPSNSQVYIDDRYKGQTPLDIDLENGNYRVMIVGNSEYETKSSSIEISNSSKKTINIYLNKKRTYVASINLDKPTSSSYSNSYNSKNDRNYGNNVYDGKIKFGGFGFHYLKIQPIVNKNIYLLNEIEAYEVGITVLQSSQSNSAMYFGKFIEINYLFADYTLENNNTEISSNDQTIISPSKINFGALSLAYSGVMGFGESLHISAGLKLSIGLYSIDSESSNDFYTLKENDKITYYDASLQGSVILKLSNSLMLITQYNYSFANQGGSFNSLKYGFSWRP